MMDGGLSNTMERVRALIFDVMIIGGRRLLLIVGINQGFEAVLQN